MMRSGLQKPGAIPFLALLIFSLLSLVPSLTKEWDLYYLRVGSIGYSPAEGRHSPRAKDISLDLRSRIRPTGNHNSYSYSQGNSWSLNNGDDALSGLDRQLQSRPWRAAALDPSPRSSLEVGNSVGYTVQDPSTLTRVVRAFKSFVFNQPVDSHIAQPSAPKITSETQPTPIVHVTHSLNSTFFTPVPPSILEAPGISPSGYNSTTTTEKVGAGSSQLWFPGSRGSWQQACRGVGDYLGKTIAQYRLLIPGPQPSRPSNSPSKDNLTAQLPPDSELLAEGYSPATLPSVDSEEVAIKELSQPSNCTDTLTNPSDSSATTAGQFKAAGLGHSSESKRGSCMAIVIGLVVSVMWF